MKREKLIPVLLCCMFVGFLTLWLSGGALAQGKAGAFPSNENLKTRNVALEMEGFEFASGLRRDSQGNPNCNGTELVRSTWSGSGFIIREDGTTVTNYHVARKSVRAQAKFEGGAAYQIRNIKVYDPGNDVAIFKMSGEPKFSTVEMGDSSKVEPQDRVLAVGNTLDMGLNVTPGQVSQVLRDDNNNVVLIRHTATIAPGNSGGALYKGSQVVGVNVSMVRGSGINQAIPINTVRRLLQDPQYASIKRLEDIFPPNFGAIAQKVQAAGVQVYATNGQVPTAANREPGVWPLKFPLEHLEDLLMLVQSPSKDLQLMVVNARGDLIGCGGPISEIPGIEPLLMSSDYRQDVVLAVANFGNSPANFGLTVYKIVW